MTEGYLTPEGHWLYKPLLLPDVRDFSDLFDYLAEWDHPTMSPTGGQFPEGRPEPVKVGGNGFGAGNELGRALVVAEHGYIIGSHWLAYIDPATVPTAPAEVAS